MYSNEVCGRMEQIYVCVCNCVFTLNFASNIPLRTQMQRNPGCWKTEIYSFLGNSTKVDLMGK